jgi:hypothetical protein
MDFSEQCEGACQGRVRCRRTPRSATLDRTDLERLTETASAIKAKSKYSERHLREMHDAVELDKRERADEEAFRLEFYNELTMEARRAWIVPVDADVYDAAERQDWGRPLFTQYKDERTSGGIGVDVDPLLWNGEFEEFESETEIKKEGNEESDDERTAEEVLGGTSGGFQCQNLQRRSKSLCNKMALSRTKKLTCRRPLLA